MKTIILMLLLFSGTVFSVPENPYERKQYTSSLSSMASMVMRWYSDILDSDTLYSDIPNSGNFYFDEIKQNYFKNFITQYPNDVTQIEIISTDLIQLDKVRQYQFIVGIKLRNKEENIIRTRFMSDTFVFQFNASQKLELQKVTGSQFQPPEPQSSNVISDDTFTSSYFKNREVAYSWLSYLDGATMADDIKQQFDQVPYSLTIGNKSWQDSAISTLNKRQSYLAVGGHVLRVVKEKTGDLSTDIRIIELTIDWRGVDKNNTPVWANIQQKIKYKLFKNGEWEVISVEEKHLLPDNKPWTGLLC